MPRPHAFQGIIRRRMSLLRPFALSFLAGLSLCVLPMNAGGEKFVDVYYGGWNLNSNADVSVSGTGSSVTAPATASGDLSSSWVLGARMGGWFPAHKWFGLGVDIGYIDAEGAGIDAKIFPVSLFLAFRAPLLATSGVPSGRLQPYAMGGLSIAMVDISVSIDGAGGSSTQGGGCMFSFGECGSPPISAYLAAGVAWQPVRNVALFAEYRHSHFDVDYETPAFFPDTRVDASINTDIVLFGISFRFGAQEANPPREPPGTVPPDVPASEPRI